MQTNVQNVIPDTVLQKKEVVKYVTKDTIQMKPVNHVLQDNIKIKKQKPLA